MTEIYTPSEVQKQLGIDSSTLRKYAIVLEGNGYHIQRNHRGHRSYVEKDVTTLRKLIETFQQEGMTIEQSAQVVIKNVSEESKTNIESELKPSLPLNDDDQEQNVNDRELLERIERLEQVNTDLLNLLKEKAIREAHLEEKLNHILKYVEKTEQLMAERSHFLEEETRKQLAAAQQKKWWQWWK